MSFIPLEDDTPCPFGKKYNGTRMEDVPVDYLHWFWTECKSATSPAANLVRDYIKSNLEALKMENKDLIWI